MSKLILTAPVLAIATTAIPAYAQDSTWTGFYVGVHGAMVDTGPEWSGSSIYQTIDAGEGSFTAIQHSVAISEKLSSSQIGGGGRLGFNWQVGNFLLGAEADATFFDSDRVVSHVQPMTTFTVASHASNLETVRARVGFASDSVLLFATGGVAFSNLEHSLTATNVSHVLVEGGTNVGFSTANLAATADSGTGWTIGGGGEVRLTDNLSVATTLLHVDFGSEDLADAEAPSSIAATVDTTMFVGMLGLNLRF